MKNAIVIGADGFIGSHLLQFLSSAHVETWALVLPGSTRKEQLAKLPGVHMIECTLDDLPTRDVEKDVHALYYLAWNGAHPNHRNDFAMQYENLELGMNCVRFASEIGAQKVIFPGSTFEYMFCNEPIRETSIPSANTAYGSVKLATRILCQQLAADLGVSFVYTVIAGIYSEDRRDNNVIYYAIDKLLRAEKPSFTPMEQLCDYVHIEDAVRALFLIGAMEVPRNFYTIGTGKERHLWQYIATIRDIIDPSLPLGIGERPYPGGIPSNSCVDLTALWEDTGYEPKILFEDGIQKMIKILKKEYCKEEMG